MKALKLLLLLSLAAVACGACKKSSNNPLFFSSFLLIVIVARVEVTLVAVSVEVEQTVQLSVRALDENGNVLSKMIIWTSAAGVIATVNTIGLVTGLAAGTAAISATAEG